MYILFYQLRVRRLLYSSMCSRCLSDSLFCFESYCIPGFPATGTVLCTLPEVHVLGLYDTLYATAVQL